MTDAPVDSHALLDSLASLHQKIDEPCRLEDVLNFVHDEFSGHLPCDRVAYSVFDPQRCRLIHRGESGADPVLRPGTATPLAGSSLETALRTGQPLILRDVEEYLLLHPDSAATLSLQDHGFRSCLAIPLYVHGSVAGCLFVSSRQPQAYHSVELDWFREIAGQFAWMVERARLHDDLRQTREELQRMQDAVDLARRDKRPLSGEMRQIHSLLHRRDSAQPAGYRFSVWNPGEESAEGLFVDLRDAGDGQYGILMVDHGRRGETGVVTAAALRGLARGLHWSQRTPRDVLLDFASGIDDTLPGTPVDGVLACVFDAKVGICRWIDAGFPLPLLVRASGYVVDEFARTDRCEIGGNSDVVASEETPLNPGDKLVFFSRGLAELAGETTHDDARKLHAVLKDAFADPACGVVRRIAEAAAGWRRGSGRTGAVAALVIERRHDHLAVGRVAEVTTFPWRQEKSRLLPR